METVGEKITDLVPTKGFCAELGTALTVLIASNLGLPVSTTHTLIGCVVAIGLTSGDRRAIDFNRTSPLPPFSSPFSSQEKKTINSKEERKREFIKVSCFLPC